MQGCRGGRSRGFVELEALAISAYFAASTYYVHGPRGMRSPFFRVLECLLACTAPLRGVGSGSDFLFGRIADALLCMIGNRET